MKIVVAGGSGMIGRHLCAALATDGNEVVVLTRDSRRALGPGIRSVEWRPPRLAAWAVELDGAGAVVNLAGASIGRWPWTARRRRILRDSRIGPTRVLIEAIEQLAPSRRPPVLLSGSGTDLYEGRDTSPAAENTPPGDSYLARLCLRWEAEARRAERLGVRVVLLRTSLVVTRDAASLRLMSLPFRLFIGGRIGSGRQWMSWVAIDDAVGIIRWAIETPTMRGPLNLSAPDPRRQAAFGRAIAGAIHRPYWFPMPAWLVRLVLGRIAVLALGSRRVWPGRALAGGYVFRVPTLEAALERAL